MTSLTVWVNSVADLSGNRRVYALGMMGQPGKSVPDQPIRTRAKMVEWLSSGLDYFGIRGTDLVGYSYGGFAALNYAVLAPDRVEALVILFPAGGLAPLKAIRYQGGIEHADWRIPARAQAIHDARPLSLDVLQAESKAGRDSTDS